MKNRILKNMTCKEGTCTRIIREKSTELVRVFHKLFTGNMSRQKNGSVMDMVKTGINSRTDTQTIIPHSISIN